MLLLATHSSASSFALDDRVKIDIGILAKEAWHSKFPSITESQSDLQHFALNIHALITYQHVTLVF